MTSPALAQTTHFGRLYRRPGTPILTSYYAITDAVKNGTLVPSVTNVIGVMDKPFLNTWHAKQAALAAVEVSQTHPGLIVSKPDEAVEWLKNAAVRSSGKATSLGNAVHDAVETLTLGEDPGVLDPKVEAHVESWKAFVKDFRPEFIFTEASVYGSVPSENEENLLGYAGTIDFVAMINGVKVVGDYKTGTTRTEAALQLSALSHADLIAVDETSPVVPFDGVGAGIVVSLSSRGYKVIPAQITGTSWEQFKYLRRAWDFHVENLNSRSPLLLDKPLSGPEYLEPEIVFSDYISA